MTIQQLNNILRALTPAAKKQVKAQKKGEIGKSRLVKLTVPPRQKD